MSDLPSLYVRYVASMEALKGLRRPAWVVHGYRGDRYPGRWECALGSGRFLGPFATPVEAMETAVAGNAEELGRAQEAERARTQKLSALHQPEW